MRTTLDAAGNPIPAWRTFWFLFGASNQLLAALTLLGVTVWLWRTRRTSLVWFITGIPTVFMYTMSTWALVKMTWPKFFDADGPIRGAARSGAVGRRGADRAGGHDARRGGAGNCEKAVAAYVASAGAGDKTLIEPTLCNCVSHTNKIVYRTRNTDRRTQWECRYLPARASAGAIGRNSIRQ